MAKKRKSDFEYLRAHVNGEGDADFHWKLKSASVAGSVAHDEDVSDWTDAEIATCAKQMAGAEEDDPIKVEVIHG